MDNKEKPSLYYTPPSDEVFEEVKSAAIRIWQTYDRKHGYVDEKVGRIKDLPNVTDNLMYIVAMFDWTNQRKLARSLGDESNKAIRERMKEGGMPSSMICF